MMETAEERQDSNYPAKQSGSGNPGIGLFGGITHTEYTKAPLSTVKLSKEASDSHKESNPLLPFRLV